MEKRGKEKVYVKEDAPVVFTTEQEFTTDGGKFRNLVYRIHFTKIPFSLTPFYLTAGSNVGLMVVITLDEKDRPVLVTTVHTCGCYAAVVPTNHLPKDALPTDWPEQSQDVHREKLPSMLDLENKENPRVVVHIRPAIHRVMHLEVVDAKALGPGGFWPVVLAPMEDVDDLKTLPVNGKTTSFYHDKGLLKGHVKGSVKPWESLFMSWASLDLFVGADKVYGDAKKTGNPFYTSLKPWNRNRSDMFQFQRFLRFHGWRL
jgi:hypothetical protein